MTPVWEETFKVRYAESDREGFMRLDGFFGLMQEVAANHADDLGAGPRNGLPSNNIWVLSRLKIAFHKVPVPSDMLTVRTWPSGFEKLFASREFEIRYHYSGEIVSTATSCWLLLDSRKLRPLRLPDALPVSMPDNSALPRYFTSLEKIGRQELHSPVSTVIRESFIDTNQHLNNARYIAQLFDWLRSQGADPSKTKKLQVNFILATQSGLTLETAGTLNKKSFYVESSADGKLRFQAEGEF